MDYTEPVFFRVMQYAAGVDRDVIDMVSGDPDWESPTALRESLHGYADLDGSAFQYPPSEGLEELREEIASRRNVDPESVLITHGAGEANHLAMAEALHRHAGSEFLLTDPVYPYYAGRVNLLEGTPRFAPVESDGSLSVGVVDERVSDDTACIIVNTPNNPTGAVYARDTIRELVQLAEDHDALLVVDEVYDHFDYTGTFESAVGIESSNRLVTNSFSKAMAITGFRVGYAIIPAEMIDRMRTRHMLTTVTGSRPPQYAVLHALRNTEPTYYESTRQLLQERIETFAEALDRIGAEYTSPSGAFYVMARFDDFPGTLENVQRLIDEAGVACMPGETFGRVRANWLRFALVTPRVESAVSRLAEFFS